MALVAGRGEIFRAYGGFMKRTNLGAGVGVGEDHIGIKAVDGLSVSAVQPFRAIVFELPKVHVEGAILLQHEEDVVDFAGGGRAYGKSCRCSDGGAVGSRGGGRVWGGGGRAHRPASARQPGSREHRAVKRKSGCGTQGDLPLQDRALTPG